MGRRDCIYNSVGALWSFLFPFFCCRKHSLFTRFFYRLPIGIHVPLHTYLYKYEKEWEQRERERACLFFYFYFSIFQFFSCT